MGERREGRKQGGRTGGRKGKEKQGQPMETRWREENDEVVEIGRGSRSNER